MIFSGLYCYFHTIKKETHIELPFMAIRVSLSFLLNLLKFLNEVGYF